MPESSRAADVSLVLDASPEQVWQALTDARELTRWFPVDAKVDPGVGGSVTWRWDDHFTSVARIETWEPRGRLRLVQEREPPHAADGSALAGETGVRIIMDFTIETRDGQTRLRVVHSGFNRGDAWDDEIEGVTIGWESAFYHLRHYLERHRGHDRQFGWAWATSAGSHADAWKALTGDGGFAFDTPAPPATGPFSVRTPDGTVLTGEVQLHVPDREWVGTARELGDGLIRLATWRGGGRTGIQVWCSTWQAEHADRVAAIGQAARRFLNQRFDRRDS